MPRCRAELGLGRTPVLGQALLLGQIVFTSMVGRDYRIASRAVIGDRVVIYGQVGIAGGVTVGDDVVVMGQSRVSKDIPRKRTVSGAYARDHGEELRVQAKIRKL